jgi:hypothetical protein
MTNPFLASTQRMINQHGQSATYIKVSEGSYNIETGSTTNTDTSYTVKMYKKHIKATQYNYPSLIGKTSAIFYLVGDALDFTPAIRDKIVAGNETFEIESIAEHSARGQVILYKLIAVKG